jgi:hypothetical protein
MLFLSWFQHVWTNRCRIIQKRWVSTFKDLRHLPVRSRPIAHVEFLEDRLCLSASPLVFYKFSGTNSVNGQPAGGYFAIDPTTPPTVSLQPDVTADYAQPIDWENAFAARVPRRQLC